MQGGDLLKAAEVFKSLLQLAAQKPLSFREKKMLERARHMLLSEVAIAREIPEVHAAATLQRALAKAGLALPPES
jgi:CarD family transcriptional regulator